MIIERENYFPIIKTKFHANDIQYCTNEQLLLSIEILKDIINNYTLNTFDFITLLRKHYTNNLQNSINAITNEEFYNVKYNCLYQSKLMNHKLEEIDIKSYFLSYQARCFALKSGDKKIGEAHVSVVIPTVIGNDISFIIFDPGLKIDMPISFCYGKGTTLLASGSSIVKIGVDNNCKYPYYIDVDGINKYSYNKSFHPVYQRFNPLFYTENPDNILCPYSYKLLLGYKAITFSSDINKRSYISLNHLEGKLKLYDEVSNDILLLSYRDILRIGRNSIIDIFKPFCVKLNIEVEELVDNVFFMIEIHKQFIDDVMDEDVMSEYEKINKVRIRR